MISQENVRLVGGGGTVYMTRAITVPADRAISIYAWSTNSDNAPTVQAYIRADNYASTDFHTSFAQLRDNDGNAIAFDITANKNFIRLCGPVTVAIRATGANDYFMVYS